MKIRILGVVALALMAPAGARAQVPEALVNAADITLRYQI